MKEYIAIGFSRNNLNGYAPFGSIVNSSGMGKSRALHEISRSVFVIPICLREGNQGICHPTLSLYVPISEMIVGYPPPDEAVRNFFQSPGSVTEAYYYSLCFLTAFGIELDRWLNKSKYKELLKQRPIPSHDIANEFHNDMTDGMTYAGHNKDRTELYGRVIATASNVSSFPAVVKKVITT